MNTVEPKDKTFLWLQLAFVFFLPLWQQASVICIILMLVLSLFSGRMKSSFSLFTKDKVLWLFVAFYLIHVIGMFYSENTKYGFFDLQVKLSYFLFPLLLPYVLLNTGSLRKIKWAFVAGNTLGALICLVLAISEYAGDHSPAHFFYMDYSYYLHTTYFSMYLNLSVIFLLEEWMKVSGKNKSGQRWIPFLILFLLLNIILLFARTSLVVSFITIGLFLFLSRKNWILERRKILFIVSGTIFLVIAQLTTFHFNNRFVQVEQVLEKSISHGDVTRAAGDSLSSPEDNSTSTRLRLWGSAIDLIKKNPLLGVGTGDIKDELMLQYASSGYQYGIKGDLNPHSQYLHTGVILGVIGVLLLLAYLFIPLRIAFNSRNWVYLSFILIVLLNALTESIMEVQKGVLLIAYFQVLLYVNLKYGRTGDGDPFIEKK